MGMENFFSNLPRGKEDAPLLFAMGPLVYDFHDVDGQYYMLDKRLGGCLTLMWAKPMDDTVTGIVTVDGNEIKGSVLTSMAIMGNMWILGIPLRGIVREYDRVYKLHVEGFKDIDGNYMNPQDFEVTAGEKPQIDGKYQEHEAVALQAATEGIVLLENKKDVLPIASGTTINLFGRGVHEFRNSAVGAGKINPRYSINFVEAINESQDVAINKELVDFYSCCKDEIPSADILKRAKEKSNMAFMLISRASGENYDNTTAKGEYYLTDEEEALLKVLSEEFEKLIVILNVGYPISMKFVKDYKVDALVYSGFGGMLGGKALLDTITGKSNPSGKLPDTWALDYFDIPSSKNFYDAVDKEKLHADIDVYVDTVYEEDIYVGYRYFETFNKSVAYPFGYGLSYTSFLIEPEDIKFDELFVNLKIHVKNMGKCSGKEVVQVYVKKPDGEIEKPSRELVYFNKTSELKPLDSETIEVSIPVSHLTYYSEAKAAYILEKGEYGLYVGNSVKAQKCGSFEVSEERIIKKVKNRMVPAMAIKKLCKGSDCSIEGNASGVIEDKKTFIPYQKREIFDTEFKGKKKDGITFADVKKDLSLLEDYVASLSVEELSRLTIGASAGWGMEGVGEACSMAQMEGFDIPRFPVADGNTGVNLKVSNIGMPSSATVAASFNTKLSKEVGRVIGEEAKELGIPLVLAPAMNIHRNPLNGRQPEYFSEDPYQSGMMAGAFSKGMEEVGVASCIKHVLGNNCETSRKRNQSIISERAIREIYFKTFEYAMEVNMPASVMTAYNAVNGVPTAADSELILGLLREECGFDGYVMTDWTTYDSVDVASMVAAGNCWITPGSLDDTFTSQVEEGVKNGTIQLERLQSNVAYMLRTIARFS